MSIWLFLVPLVIVAIWTLLNSLWVALVVVPLLALWAAAVRRWLWRKEAAGRVVAFLPLAAIAFLLYTDKYPLDSFYQQRFTRITGIPYPKDAELKFKEFNSMGNGDTYLCLLVEVSDQDYQQIRKKQMPPSASQFRPTGCLEGIRKKYGKFSIAAETAFDETPEANYYWALVAERPEVIISYSLW